MAMRDWVTKDFGWKLASLLVATVIWHIVHTGIGEEPVIENPLAVVNSMTFTNLPVLTVAPADSLREFKINPNTVTVTISGSGQALDGLQQGEIHPIVNLTGIMAADNMSKHVNVYTPSGVTLVSVDPPEVSVTILPQAEKKP
jgi:hypothetical protein